MKDLFAVTIEAAAEPEKVSNVPKARQTGRNAQVMQVRVAARSGIADRCFFSENAPFTGAKGGPGSMWQRRA